MGVIAGSYKAGTAAGGMPIPGTATEADVHYLLRTDSDTDNPITIYATGTLPAQYTAHPDNIFLTVRSISCNRDPKSRADNALWTGVIHYSSSPLTKQQEEQALSPLDREAKISWDEMPYQVPILFGYQNNKLVPIMNSANDTPDPVPEDTICNWVANVTKNITSVPSWVNQGYSRSVNTTSFTIEGLTIPAECARLFNLRISEKMKENNVQYRQLSFSLEIREKRDQRLLADGSPNTDDDPPPPFDLELPDMGLHEWDFINQRRIRFKDDDTPPQNVAQPIMMNGTGSKLTSPTAFNIVLLTWRIAKKRDFTVLPLT